MTDKIKNADEALALATKIICERVPTAKCELQDYAFRIGCGDMDAWGNIQEVKLKKDNWDEEAFQHAAKVLETKIRTGGSTAG